MIYLDLTGRTALITGAGRGLGRATAKLLYAAGANIVVNYFDDPKGANEDQARSTVQSLGERAIAMAADVRNLGAVEKMIRKTVDHFGGLDIVINNAGILRDRTLKKITEEEWQSVIDTNLTGVFNMCKAAAEHIRNGGRIVNLASITAVCGFFGQSNYAASKAGVIALTKVLSKELGKRRITVNAVAPGVVLTDMGKSIPEEVRGQMLGQIPLGRFAESEEIAGAILFLCSDLAAYVTGQTLHVNGGWWA